MNDTPPGSPLTLWMDRMSISEWSSPFFRVSFPLYFFLFPLSSFHFYSVVIWMKERGCCCRRKTKADKAGWFYFLSFGKVHTSIIYLSITVINPPIPSFSFCLLILSLFFPFCLLLPNETPVYPFALSLSLFSLLAIDFSSPFSSSPGRRGHLFPFFLLVFVPPGTHTHAHTHARTHKLQ